MAQTILIVDDDPAQRRHLETLIGRDGYRTLTAGGGNEALETVSREPAQAVDLVLLELAMADMGGIEVLSRIKPRRPDLPVIVLTAQSGVDTVVRAMQAGAADFIVKPASPERLGVSIANALKLNALTGQISRLARRVGGELSFQDLIGTSPAMRKVTNLAKRAATSNISVLIEGESGVGKEMVARAIQGYSERAGKPFVAVNCGAIPEKLVESILFGHEKGASTGANERHVGKFQEADGGTLFLDEIGEVRPDIQVKLLRALQQGEIDPVGGNRPVEVDIRLISATNSNLNQMVEDGRFREDLYYRLNVYPIYVPPLRERREDIGALVEHFIATFAVSEGKPVRGADQAARELIASYAWPGNVRQLENVIYRAVVLSDDEILGVDDFLQLTQAMGRPRTAPPEPPAAPSRPPPMPSSGGRTLEALNPNGEVRSLEEVEGEMIRLALRRYRGRMSEVARRLGIGRSTLYRKVESLGIDVRAPDTGQP